MMAVVVVETAEVPAVIASVDGVVVIMVPTGQQA